MPIVILVEEIAPSGVLTKTQTSQATLTFGFR